MPHLAGEKDRFIQELKEERVCNMEDIDSEEGVKRRRSSIKPRQPQVERERYIRGQGRGSR